MEFSESGNRDSGGEGKGEDAGAISALAPDFGWVSDERAANGGVMAGVKKAKKTNLVKSPNPSSPLHAQRARLAGFMPRMKPDKRVYSLFAREFWSRKRNGALASAGARGGKRLAEWSVGCQKLPRETAPGERESAGFQSVV